MTEPGAVSARIDDGPRPGRARLDPNAQVWLIIAGMAALLVVEYFLLPDRDSALRFAPGWIIVPIALAIALAERTAFDIEIGDQGHSFSLGMLPTAFAAVYLAPVSALAARLVGALPMMYGPRRNRGAKLVFNTLLFSIETFVFALIPRLVIRWWDDTEPILLFGLMAGMFVGTVNTGLEVASVVSRFEGTFVDRVRAEVLSLWWFYAINVVFAGMSVGLVMHEPWLGLAVAPAAIGIWSVMRSFGRLTQEMNDLDALHGFAGRVGSTLDIDEISKLAVHDVIDLIRADGATLLIEHDGAIDVETAGHMPVRLPLQADDERWELLSAPGKARLLPAEELRAFNAVTDDRLRMLMVAPVVDDGRVFGVLLVVERNVQRYRFTEADVARLQNMADQLAVSLRRGLLHERLEYEARHDALTGLPARTLFERAVADAIATPDERVAAVMMLDLDRFKEVNDTLGHHAGDALLIEFSRRMSTLLDEGDILARLAGDEFAILCRRADVEAAVGVAQACVRAGSRPVVLDGLEIVVTVSVGVALIGEVETDPLQPMRRADIAMYNAKWQRTGVEVYRDEIDRRTPARLSMLGDLRAAIENDEIDVLYQAKLDLRCHAVVGAEALVRWNSPSRGVVAPAEFVRVAEDTGLIKDLTDLVLKRGIAALRRFDDHGLGLRLAVNLSTHDLFDNKLPTRVLSQLAVNGVDPSAVTLEITESSLLIDAPRTRATIDDLHQAGFRLAIDDFGTGYSSLSYLRRLPVQELKIDQSFVSHMLTDPQDEVIVKSTIDLGHNLQLSVVAEGVEDAATLDALAEMGCDIAQGYAIARPLTADELIAWVGSVRRDGLRLQNVVTTDETTA